MTKKEMVEQLREAYKYFEELSYTFDTMLDDEELRQLDPNLHKILLVADALDCET